MHELKVLYKLVSPRVDFVCGIPAGVSKPSSHHGSGFDLLTNNTLEPFESTKAEFKVRRQKSASLENVSMCPSRVFISQRVIGVGLAQQKDPGFVNDEAGKLVALTVKKHKSLEG